MLSDLRVFLSFQVLENKEFVEMLANLTVNKDDSSLARRKKVCADDNRHGAVASGGIAIFVVIAVGSLVIGIDLSRVYALISTPSGNQRGKHESYA